ncbi:hypothetical protein DEO72_LG10g678 [Vigna unguiculata]|uniref:Uncharacterized protein n=1 Tax=Vigna unguiculata TaxID=3917 RepID=A0A4D6N837_VIGUN|nr:hypothetical protein DEO72_LG10g678 [Vigna unguiculata]
MLSSAERGLRPRAVFIAGFQLRNAFNLSWRRIGGRAAKNGGSADTVTTSSERIGNASAVQWLPLLR